jgi:hypothetical protein
MCSVFRRSVSLGRWRFSKRIVIALGFAAMVVGARDARAQYIVNGPNGSLGISNGYGRYTLVYWRVSYVEATVDYQPDRGVEFPGRRGCSRKLLARRV